MHAHDRRGELQNKCLNVSATAGHVRAQKRIVATLAVSSIREHSHKRKSRQKAGLTQTFVVWKRVMEQKLQKHSHVYYSKLLKLCNPPLFGFDTKNKCVGNR